jgi:hypothetical protein
MITLTVGGKEYKVEFRHLIREGKKPGLGRNCPVRAITTAVIVGDGFIAIDSAVCSNTDNFSREVGRNRALWKALKHAPLKDVRATFFSIYMEHRPQHVGYAPTQKVTKELRDELIKSGESVRKLRSAKKR